MMPLPDGYEKEDPANWINRPLNGYMTKKKQLMVTAEKNPKAKPPSGGFVTDCRCGITLTLCRRIREEGASIAVPVGRDEVVLWNVPVKTIISDALSNTARLFPPQIYDLYYNKYIELHNFSAGKGRYRFDPEESEVAENSDIYENGRDSGLRFIVSTDKIVGDTIVLYPDLLRELAYRLFKNPTVLICGPGKMYIFESGKRKKSIRNYLERYRNYIGDPSYDPYMFRFIKENNALIDLNKEAEPKINPLAEAKIPQGSIASAWGDLSYRRDMIEWKRGKNTPKEDC